MLRKEEEMGYHELDGETEREYEVLTAEQLATVPPAVSAPAQAIMEAKLRAGDPAEDLARGMWFQERAAELVQALLD